MAAGPFLLLKSHCLQTWEWWRIYTVTPAVPGCNDDWLDSSQRMFECRVLFDSSIHRSLIKVWYKYFHKWWKKDKTVHIEANYLPYISFLFDQCTGSFGMNTGGFDLKTSSQNLKYFCEFLIRLWYLKLNIMLDRFVIL